MWFSHVLTVGDTENIGEIPFFIWPGNASASSLVAGGSGWGEGSLGFTNKTAAPITQKQISRRRWRHFPDCEAWYVLKVQCVIFLYSSQSVEIRKLQEYRGYKASTVLWYKTMLPKMYNNLSAPESVKCINIPFLHTVTLSSWMGAIDFLALYEIQQIFWQWFGHFAVIWGGANRENCPVWTRKEACRQCGKHTTVQSCFWVCPG